MIDVKKPLFKPGQIVATPGCLASLEKAGESIWTYLARHIQGDFGDVDQDDWRANEEALKDGSRIFSVYTLKTGDRIWVITEAVGDDGQRASTAAILPDEY